MNQIDDAKLSSAKSNLYTKNRKYFLSREKSKNYSKSEDSKASIDDSLNSKEQNELFSISTPHNIRSSSQNDNLNDGFVNATISSSSSSLESLEINPTNDVNNNTALPSIIASQQRAKTLLDPFFGQSELDRLLPKQTLQISVLTWNMSSKAPENYTSSIERLLCLNDTNVLSDVYVIGLQETPKSDLIQYQMKMGIQAMLGPHFVLLRWETLGVLHCSIWIRRELLWCCTTVRSFPVNSRPVAANRIRTKGALALTVEIFGTAFLFINTHLSAHTANLKTRMNQMDKIQQTLGVHWNRSKSIENLTNLTSDGFSFRNPGQSDYIFWFGDLNFRLERSLEQVMQSVQLISSENNTERRIALQRELMQADQLSNLMTREIIFANFHEALFPPPFLPTYKCREKSKSDTNSDNFSSYSSYSGGSSSVSSHNTITPQTELTPSTSSSEMANESPKKNREDNIFDDNNFLPKLNSDKQLNGVYEISNFEYNTSRVPSFTDRILYQKGSSHEMDAYPNVRCDIYTTIPDLFSSDHKPVYARFEVGIIPGEMEFETINLNGTKRDTNTLQINQKDNLNSANKGVSSFFRLKKRQNINKYTQTELLAGRALSVSTSSLLAASVINGNNGERVTNSAKQRVFIDKITDLNAGEFDHQIYIDGLKLRSAVYAFRSRRSKTPSESESIMPDSFETAKAPSITPKRTINKWGMFKSRSLDSTLTSNSNSLRFVKPYQEQSYQDLKTFILNDSFGRTKTISQSRNTNVTRNTIASAPITVRGIEGYSKGEIDLNSPTASPTDPSTKSSICNIS